MKNKVVKYFSILFILFLSLIIILLFNDVIWVKEPSLKKYPVRGIDVSHYQGKIDWSVISKQNIKFAFIKATEGSNNHDECFYENWKNIALTDI